MRTPVKPCCVILEPMTPQAIVNFSSELKHAINERNMLTSKTRKRVTEALDELHDESVIVSIRSRKQNILSEIVESEESYVRQLEIILEFFMKPIQERQLLKPHDFDALFGNLKTIYRVNKELLEELSKGSDNVTRAFSNIAPFFKCYSFYASGFKRSLKILQNNHKHNPCFAKFLELQETRPEVQSKLSALLIAPIQRVPRYRLLLQPLFNLTSPAESSYDSLLDSLLKVEDAAGHINKIIKDQENMQRLLELQRCLQSGHPNIITPGRNLIKEGPLMRMSAKNGHSQKIHLVLTNDIMMFCKIKKDHLTVDSLKCTGIYPLSKCQLVEVLEKGAFKVYCQDEETILFHDSFSETVKWIDIVKSTIQQATDDRKTLKKEYTVRRPVKRKDVREYNEVGLSPGVKLKKKKTGYEDNSGISKPLVLTRRKPLRSYEESSGTPSFLVSLKPQVEKKRPNVSREVFVFGQPQPDRGFSFKMNQWFNRVGSSVKTFLGLK